MIANGEDVARLHSDQLPSPSPGAAALTRHPHEEEVGSRGLDEVHHSTNAVLQQTGLQRSHVGLQALGVGPCRGTLVADGDGEGLGAARLAVGVGGRARHLDTTPEGREDRA